MLFSLVLAVASKEVELWQSFDDFAPRQLQEDMEELDGDEVVEGDEISDEDDEMSEGEEAGLNPLHVAVPVAGLAGLAGLYFMMNGGDSGENKGEEGFDKQLAEFTEKLQTGDPGAVGVTLAASLAVAGGLAYALTGSAPPPITSGNKFIKPVAGVVGTGAVGGLGYYLWNRKTNPSGASTTTTPAEDEEAKKKAEALAEKEAENKRQAEAEKEAGGA